MAGSVTNQRLERGHALFRSRSKPLLKPYSPYTPWDCHICRPIDPPGTTPTDRQSHGSRLGRQGSVFVPSQVQYELLDLTKLSNTSPETARDRTPHTHDTSGTASDCRQTPRRPVQQTPCPGRVGMGESPAAGTIGEPLVENVAQDVVVERRLGRTSDVVVDEVMASPPG